VTRTPAPAPRILIVNADDFGLAVPVTDGILEAHIAGIVTSTSLMVLQPDAERAAALAAAHPALGVGLHLDLGEWAFRRGSWVQTRHVVDLRDERAVSDEIVRQMDRFRALVGRPPSHLDSHQHLHSSDPIARSCVREPAERWGIPVRALDPRIRFCGDFYGQGREAERHPEWISADALLQLLRDLPAGTTELGCHPGRPGVRDAYGPERALELAALTDPRLPAFLAQQRIRLISFSTLDEVHHARPVLL